MIIEKMMILKNIEILYKSRFLHNGIWLYLLQIFNTIVPLLTLPYVTRIFGAEKYGAFSIAFNIYGYIQVLVEYGFILSATRKMALNSRDVSIANILFSSVFFARIFLAFVSMFFALLYSIINIKYPEQCICLLIMSIFSFGYSLQIHWFFQGIEDMKYISLTTIIARTFLVLCIFIFVKTPDDIYLYSLFMTILPFISGAISMAVANKKYSLHIVKVSTRDIINEIKDGFLVFTTSLSSKVFASIGITFLGIFSTPTEVGIYYAIQKIPNILIFIWLPIGQILYPLSSKKMTASFMDGKNFVYKVRRIIMILFLCIAIIISIFSKTIIDFIFGDEYTVYHYWVFPLLIWLLLSINNNFLGHQILLGGGFDKIYSKCFQIGVCISVFLNFILIYFFILAI